MSEQFIFEGFKITLSDIRDHYCDLLKDKFKNVNEVSEVLKMDIVDPEFDTKFSRYFGTFDTVFALNVIEHIEDHKLALKNIWKLLRNGGNVIILVPAYQALYNKLDQELCHYRRYNRELLSSLFNEDDYTLIKLFNFNFVGIIGWFVSGKLQKNKTLPAGQIKLYNMLVPIFRIVDKLVLNRVGLSLIGVGHKQSIE